MEDFVHVNLLLSKLLPTLHVGTLVLGSSSILIQKMVLSYTGTLLGLNSRSQTRLKLLAHCKTTLVFYVSFHLWICPYRLFLFLCP